MTETLLQVNNVHKRFAGMTTDVLVDVNMTIAAGEYVAIMGKSGSGKSTLLHVAAGLDKPTRGEVWFLDERVSDRTESQMALFRRHRVGFVHQFFNLIDNMTALENVVMPALLAGKTYRDARYAAVTLFSQLGITGLENKLPGVLSGGQKQRIAIARALINEPALIFADEPTGSLDTQSGEAVLEVFSNLRVNGYTIVMVTHDPKVASQADRILFMQDGRLKDETVMTARSDAESLISRVLSIL